MRHLILAALMSVAWALPARAAFDDLGAGARAPGMGNAFVPIADDVYAIYYNPAGLGLLERPQFSASYTQLYMGLSDNSNLSDSFIGYAHPLSEGRQGTLASAWTTFSLNNSLYRENSFYLSYGRNCISDARYGDLYGGVSLKLLQSGFGNFDEASNATSSVYTYSGTPDPVLNQNRSQTAVDADLGVLYRFGKHYATGLQLVHLMQPNIAFSSNDTDTLPLGFKFGFNYHSLISNVVTQVDVIKAPNGTTDNTVTVGAERWFPRLFVGDFGARGGLSMGARDYKQMSLGVSYRTKRIQVDYGFALPINAVISTNGSHRIALTFRFGRATDEEESLEMILEAMKQLKAAKLASYEVAGKGLSASQKAAVDEYLAQTRALESAARYREALEKFTLALTVAPADKDLVSQFGRLNFVAQHIPILPDYRTDPMQSALREGILAYLSGRDIEAVQKVSFALSLKPDYHELDLFLAQLELTTGIKRMAILQPKKQEIIVAGLVTRANSAIQDGRYDEAIDLSLTAVRSDPENATAWQNLGTAYFALKDIDSSLRAWQKAYEYESSPSIRATMKEYIKALTRARERRGKTPVQVQPLPERAHMSPAEIQTLFNQGVDDYTRRDFEKAKKSFETILQADPTNVDAQNALRRVKEELQ